MTHLTIVLDDSRARALQEKAEQYGLKIEDLLKASVEDLISRSDEEFKNAVRKVLSKNSELYKRLA